MHSAQERIHGPGISRGYKWHSKSKTAAKVILRRGCLDFLECRAFRADGLSLGQCG
jgi:hypothetical protein